MKVIDSITNVIEMIPVLCVMFPLECVIILASGFVAGRLSKRCSKP